MLKNVFTCQVTFKKYDVSIISKNVNYLQEKTKMFMIDFFMSLHPSMIMVQPYFYQYDFKGQGHSWYFYFFL